MFQNKIIVGFIIISLILGKISDSYAQNLNGQVLNSETKSPINFASVYCLDLNSGTLTDSTGNFTLANFPTSNTIIKISAIGFETQELSVNINQSNYIEILLNPTHVHLDEIIVSAPFGKLQNETVTNVETIRLNDVNRIPTQNLSEAIANIPGVYQASLGNGIGKPVIRGLSGTRVVTYVDGLRIENQQWGDDHGMGITSLGIEGVEIIKGPASLLYGSDALGGVMYFINESYAKTNSYNFKYSSNFESNTLGANNQIGFKLNKNGFKINFFAGQNFHGDYQLPNGYRVKDSRYSNSTAKLSIGYNRKNWIGNLHYTFVNSYIGIPGHTHEDSLYTELFYSSKQSWLKTLPYQAITNHFTLFEQKIFFGKNKLEIYLGNTQNRLQEYEEKITIPAIKMNLNNSLYNVRWNQKLNSNWEFMSGVQGMYQQNKNGTNAEEFLLPEYNMLDIGAYVVTQFKIKEFNFQLGARYDFRDLKSFANSEFDAFHKAYQSYNYSAGFAYEIDSLILRLNVSSGFRAPHTSELLSDGVHHGTFRYQLGDRNLLNENAIQVDLSILVNYDHIQIHFNPFFSQISNYIYLNPTDSMVDGYQLATYYQTNSAQLFGGDFSIHVHPHIAHWLHIQSSFSYIYAQDDAENPLPLIPQNRINTQLKFELPAKRKFAITDIVLQHSFYFNQNRVGFFETQTAYYNLLHLGINFKCNEKKTLTMQTGVKNILNTNYFDHLSRLKQIGLEMPGINFYLSIKYNFETKLK